jgi:hypothetical protein
MRSENKEPYNPRRRTGWPILALPPDVNLAEIDWTPLPESADPRAQTVLFTPEEDRVAA